MSQAFGHSEDRNIAVGQNNAKFEFGEKVFIVGRFQDEVETQTASIDFAVSIWMASEKPKRDKRRMFLLF